MVEPIVTLKGKTCITRLPVVVCALLFSLGGCGQDYSLSPPADSEKITVTVKLPKELKTETMWVMYRSTTCKRIGTGASGQRTERDGYHSVYKELERQGQSDLYQVQLPKFEVVHADPMRFGGSVTPGGGGGLVVMFDYNDSPRGGADIKIDGDVAIKKGYYPWISESFLGGYEKNISLVGGGDTYLMYRALQARQVYFEPILHSDFIVYSEEPREKKEGNHTVFTYPDGSVAAERQSQPDFLKLQTLRTGRVRECFTRWRYANCPDRRPELLPEWLPEPDKPGFGRYAIVDEWGNKLPTYTYRLVGKNGDVFQDRTDIHGLTDPIPESAHPLSNVEFPDGRG